MAAALAQTEVDDDFVAVGIGEELLAHLRHRADGGDEQQRGANGYQPPIADRPGNHPAQDTIDRAVVLVVMDGAGLGVR